MKLVVDKNGMLQESFIEFEVIQEYSGGGRGERITLGNVKLNLAEYVEQSEMNRIEGDERECVAVHQAANRAEVVYYIRKLLAPVSLIYRPRLRMSQRRGSVRSEASD